MNYSRTVFLFARNSFYKHILILLVLFTATMIIIGVERNDEERRRHTKRSSRYVGTWDAHEFIDYIPTKPARIFCIILTQPENFFSRTVAVNNTWANDCDNHRFISVIPDMFMTVASNSNSSGPVEISYPFRVLQPTGHVKEDYNMLTGKVYSAFADIYNLYPDYDWYVKADDDTYIIVDHLRLFLERRDPNKALTYGYQLTRWRSGGAGYVLSKSAFHRLGSLLNFDRSFCPYSGVEDKDVAECLAELNVFVGDSVDTLGRERFHAFNISFHWHGNYMKWVYYLAVHYPQKGDMSFSNESISFHYLSPEDINKLHMLLGIFRRRGRNNNNNNNNKSNINFHNFIVKNMLN